MNKSNNSTKNEDGSSATDKPNQTGQNEQSPNPFKGNIEAISKILAPTTVLGALLFYYGWIRTDALYQTFGLNQTIIGFSNQDYALRSVTVMFKPLQGALLVALIGGWLHLMITTRLNKAKTAKWGFIISVLIAGLILVGGFIYEQAVEPDYLNFPWLIRTILVAEIGYLLFLLRLAKQRAWSVESLRHIPRPFLTVGCWLILIYLILTAFNAIGNYAQIVGRRHANQLVDEAPQIVVHSKEPLGLEGGTVATFQPDTTSIYTHHYRGLKFLIHSNDKYFLIPKDWSFRKPRLIVLNDSETIRMEFAPTIVFVESGQ